MLFMFDERALWLKVRAVTGYRPPQGHERWQLTLSWEGTGFVGWQAQIGARSVQDTLRAAFLPLCRQPDKVARPVAAGRTDAGVHAEQMTVHLDVPVDSLRPRPRQLARALNAHLPRDLAVLDAAPAPAGFHARFSCTERAYVYRVIHAPQRLPLWENRALHTARPLNHAAMRRAAALLTGDHDFAAFATQEERQTVRRLHRLELVQLPQAGYTLSEFHIAGESFLRQMVRGLIGTLLRVGEGQQNAEAVRQILASRQRSRAGANAPAHGLYFVRASYLPEASPEIDRA